MEEKRESVKNTENFEIKYRAILEELKTRPVGDTKLGEKSERWRWFQQLDDYDMIVMDMMKCISPGAWKRYEQLVGRQKTESSDSDSGIASGKRRYDVDELVLLETLRECVNGFTGVNLDGAEYRFTQSVIHRYKQLAGIAAARNDLARAGMTTEISGRNLPKVLKLSREARRMMELSSGGNIDAIIDACLEESNYTYTKKERQYVKSMVSLNIVSMDTPVDEEKEISRGDLVPDDHDPYESINEAGDGISVIFCLVSQWENIVAATFKKDCNLIKAFLSREILVQLKLRWLSLDDLEELKKDPFRDYTKELEPQCRKWCPRRAGCTYPDGHKCYVRWGRLNEREPAGDWELYEKLNPGGAELYQKILKNDYVSYAFKAEPTELYDLYANELKDFGQGENGFEFTDAVMARGLGMRKETLSRGRKKYEGEVKALLRKMFLEQE